MNRLIAHRSARGKRRRPDVEDWLLREESEVLKLREELLSGSYQPGPYRFFTIREPKVREIAAAPFRDRVVHHALCQWLAPVLERRFIARSFSCQAGKGTTAARECCRQLTNRHRCVLKCDVRKFFPNIDHDILRGKLDGVSRCPQAMALIGAILASYQTGARSEQWRVSVLECGGPPPLSAVSARADEKRQGTAALQNLAECGARPMEEIPPQWYPGDDLPAATRPRGVPIGNLTSQLWGNYYLDALDHWITETERHGAYLRYTDDFLLFGDDKARLWELRAGIVGQLAAERLKLAEPKSRLLTTTEGVPFCGFCFLPGLCPRILGATKRRFERRRCRLARARDFHRLTQSVFAWYQFSREANSEGLRRAYTRWPLASRPVS